MFRFGNREFDTQFLVNSLGVRRRGAGASSPRDRGPWATPSPWAGAYGNGIAFRLLARRLKARVLNAGVASYGTARERRLLDRVDTLKTRLLIVQYEPNDFDEKSSSLSTATSSRSADAWCTTTCLAAPNVSGATCPAGTSSAS